MGPDNRLGLSRSEFDELAISVGTHAAERRLSPQQVAEAIQVMIDSGHSRVEIAQNLGISPTMVGRFAKILQIRHEVRYHVGWGGRADQGSIPFSSALYLIRLPQDRQEDLILATSRSPLTRIEIQSVVQLFERSGDSLDDCIARVRMRRRRIIELEVVIGPVAPAVGERLRRMAQEDRDLLFKEVLKNLFPSLCDCRARLGETEFVVAGGKGMTAVLSGKLEQISHRLLKQVEGAKQKGVGTFDE